VFSAPLPSNASRCPARSGCESQDRTGPKTLFARNLREGSLAQRSGVEGPMPTLWSCPSCHRTFAQRNQRHACGTGDRDEVLRNRPDSLVRIYESIEAFAKSLGPVEIVAARTR
jgi:hypothetical protein